MARFVLRDGQQLKTFAPAQYRGVGIVGEEIIKDLSLGGSYITGNVPLDSTTPSILKLCGIDTTSLRFIIKHLLRKASHNYSLDALLPSDLASSDQFNGAFKIWVALQFWFHCSSTKYGQIRHRRSLLFPLPPLPRRHGIRISPQAFPRLSCFCL